MTPPSPPRLLVINGSLGGARGNTMKVLERFADAVGERVSLHWLHLADHDWGRSLEPAISSSDAFVFATGTYWDSWGSPLQIFLERMTSLEAGPAWLGKPAGVIVTMHSVGGKETASRLQGVLSTLGLWLPPMSAFVYSLANRLALAGPESEHKEDLWRLEDLRVVADNLVFALSASQEKRFPWSTWDVDRADPHRVWI